MKLDHCVYPALFSLLYIATGLLWLLLDDLALTIWLGGTAPAQVRAQIARHRARLG